MLDDFGLVHMNGRIYDPLLGRFLSADPIVQAPANLQSYNRYSYVFNNLLSFLDPSGYEGITNSDEDEKKRRRELADMSDYLARGHGILASVAMSANAAQNGIRVMDLEAETSGGLAATVANAASPSSPAESKTSSKTPTSGTPGSQNNKVNPTIQPTASLPESREVAAMKNSLSFRIGAFLGKSFRDHVERTSAINEQLAETGLGYLTQDGQFIYTGPQTIAVGTTKTFAKDFKLGWQIEGGVYISRGPSGIEFGTYESPALALGQNQSFTWLNINILNVDGDDFRGPFSSIDVTSRFGDAGVVRNAEGDIIGFSVGPLKGGKFGGSVAIGETLTQPWGKLE